MYENSQIQKNLQESVNNFILFLSRYI